jgi:hypothetical protein
MKNGRRLFRRSSRGSVAIEMAVILPLMLALLSVPLFYARVFWFYSVAQKAAHDSARYMTSVTQAEMRTPGTGFGEPKVVAVGRWIAQQELTELVPLTDGIPIDIQCEPGPCGAKVPQTVRVKVAIVLHDMLLDSMTSDIVGSTDAVLVGDVTMAYAGN